ncbi:MAG: hypothetical protein JNL74_19900 [Fibrobacteres bacterium]|nr:hypothetical protein [Fibrobacterota bacterium]
MTNLSERAELAWQTIRKIPTKGIPTWATHTMEHSHIDRLAESKPGEYVNTPEQIYLKAQNNAGCCIIDQYIPRNPLTMGSKGYESGSHSATTGLIPVLDGISIDSPEAVAEHLEKFNIPNTKKMIETFNEEATIKAIIDHEQSVQKEFGSNILKAPYNIVKFPKLYYSRYGYENYFMAYALFPEVLEKHFAIDSDYAAMHNRAVSKAFDTGLFPAYDRLDNDMADSRGTLVDIKSLDKIWLPHFTRAIAPVANRGYTLIWHCDGNLMQMLPRLLEAGLNGFQGFQYEYGMDYVNICKMKPKDGSDIYIKAGVSVTTTLPHGKPDDVKRELKWLVENGPKTGLTLGCSSSMAPGVPWENVKMLIDGLKWYRENGRCGAV